MTDNISHLQTIGTKPETKQEHATDTCAVLQQKMPCHGPLHVAYEEVLDISMYTMQETQNDLDTSSTFWD